MQPFDQEKFKSLVLYVIWRTGDLRDFGSVKLNKALWFSDARAFEALGKAVTGETYIREKFGPVPRHILPILDELLAEGLIQAWREPFFEFEITRYRAHQPPDIGMFTAEELGIIDWWIKHIAEEHTAASISEASHDYAWKIAKFGEALPYQAFLARRIRQPRSDELEWAKAEANRLESKSMRSVVEFAEVMAEVDDAKERWRRTEDAWEAICWVLARDPTCGHPLTEGGRLRSLVFDGWIVGA